MANYEIFGIRVETNYHPKPVPTNKMDWEAYEEEMRYDPEWDGEGWINIPPCGYGATEQEALDELKLLLSEELDIDIDGEIK